MVVEMPEPLTPDELRTIDEVCDDFEDAWCADQQPRVEDHLARVPEILRGRLLDALLPLFRELLMSSSRLPQKPGEQAAIRPELPTSNKTDVSPLPTFAGENEDAVVYLEVIEGPHRGQAFEFRQHTTFVCGRSPEAQLQVSNDPHFSRHHFRLEINPPTCYLLDLESRNGTCINGDRVQEGFLRDSDVISGGRTQMRIRILGASARKTPADGAKSHMALARFAEVEPAKIPGYQLVELLGRGDLGVTFHANHLQSQRKVALKLLQPANSIEPPTLAAFIRASESLKQLKHSRIASLLRVACLNELLYFVYEFTPDLGSLACLEKMAQAQRIRVACHWAYQVLDALNYAHAQGAVHRDIKPSNILVARQNNRWIVKLSDYGVAKRYADAGFSNIARSGDFPGSLPYTAPEQFIDSRSAAPGVDLYSIGATLYHWLTGATPHDFDQKKCPFLTILESEPIPIAQRQRQIPQRLAQIVHKATAREPRDRFASAPDMARELRSFLEPTPD